MSSSQQFELSGSYVPVSQRSVETRSVFISRTYNHLMGAIVAFTLFEVWLFSSGLAEPIAQAMLSGSFAASLELFASVALMFGYVLRLFMSRD